VTFTSSWKERIGMSYGLLLFTDAQKGLFIGCYERAAMLFSLMEAAN